MSIEQHIDALAAEAAVLSASRSDTPTIDALESADMYRRCWQAERKLRQAAKHSYSYEMVERLHAEAEAILKGES